MAATAPPVIQVYASFPRAVALGANLNINPSNWHWVHCLTLPVETLNILQFSQRPHKWIRYAIGVIVGAEGDLSPSPDSPNVVDYNASLPAKSTAFYYHTSNEEKRRMFPVDPSIKRTNLTSSSAATRKAQFRNNVAERDGRTCVLTNYEERICNAVHLLDRSRGDTYIATYTERRNRSRTGGDIVRDIDSARNGIFLNLLTQCVLGTDVAFLMTPNFAMTTADVDPTAPPAEGRCTAHLFQQAGTPAALGCLGSSALPSGSPLRISDGPEWPPPVLFDAVYADAVLCHFGTQTLEDEVTATWKDTFYPGGIKTASATHTRRLREARRESPEYDLLALPYILVPPDELKTVFREQDARKEEMEKRRVQEKVDDWMKHNTDA